MAQEKIEVAHRERTGSGIVDGEAVVSGTAVTVERILAYLAEHPDTDAVLGAFPELTRADLQAVFAYARDTIVEPSQRSKSHRESTLLTPELFYQRLTSRPDIREILTRLAK
jgi:uncharacterized protein (DUF433 family)